MIAAPDFAYAFASRLLRCWPCHATISPLAPYFDAALFAATPFFFSFFFFFFLLSLLVFAIAAAALRRFNDTPPDAAPLPVSVPRAILLPRRAAAAARQRTTFCLLRTPCCRCRHHDFAPVCLFAYAFDCQRFRFATVFRHAAMPRSERAFQLIYAARSFSPEIRPPDFDDLLMPCCRCHAMA